MASRTTSLFGIDSRDAESLSRASDRSSRVKVTFVVAIPTPYYHIATESGARHRGLPVYQTSRFISKANHPGRWWRGFLRKCCGSAAMERRADCYFIPRWFRWSHEPGGAKRSRRGTFRKISLIFEKNARREPGNPHYDGGKPLITGKLFSIRTTPASLSE